MTRHVLKQSDGAKFQPWVAALLAAMVLPATPAQSQRASEQSPRAISTEDVRIPITNPLLLEELGFPPDAQGIYALPLALERLLDPPSAEVEPEPLYGTEDDSRTGIASAAFNADRPHSSTIIKDLTSVSCGVLSDWSFASAQIPLPTGVILKGYDLFAVDQNTVHDVTLFLYEVCHSLFTQAPASTLLDSISTSGSGGAQRSFRNFFNGIIVGSNSRCTYIARLRLGNLSTSCPDALSVSHVSVAWQRRISTGPNTATFDDVPTSHPFYDEIEAVARAGITVDCPDPDKFCPNGVLTRGQIAVLLAKALGLHFPG